MEGKFVSYLRVSTLRQGQNGYGLDAQRKTVEDYLNGGNWELLTEFVENKSAGGSYAKRPVLKEALKFCKANKATLLIAKLDRLSRDPESVSHLLKSKVDFKCCDCPEANKVTLQIMAVFAEYERDLISTRTKAAMQVAKERGVKLGNPRIRELVRLNQEPAEAFARQLKPHFDRMKARGLSQRDMVEELKEKKVATRNGGQWSLTQVQRTIRYMTPKGARPSGVKATGVGRLTSLRKAAGLSQHRLAKLAGVNQSQLSRTETGGDRFKQDAAEKIAQVLGVSVDQLF